MINTFTEKCSGRCDLTTGWSWSADEDIDNSEKTITPYLRVSVEWIMTLTHWLINSKSIRNQWFSSDLITSGAMHGQSDTIKPKQISWHLFCRNTHLLHFDHWFTTCPSNPLWVPLRLETSQSRIELGCLHLREIVHPIPILLISWRSTMSNASKEALD